jgi:hypothetical protein
MSGPLHPAQQKNMLKDALEEAWHQCSTADTGLGGQTLIAGLKLPLRTCVHCVPATGATGLALRGPALTATDIEEKR